MHLNPVQAVRSESNLATFRMRFERTPTINRYSALGLFSALYPHGKLVNKIQFFFQPK